MSADDPRTGLPPWQAFHMFDSDRSGKLERSEVRKAMRVLGYPLDETEHGRELAARFEEGFSLADPDHDGALDADEFRIFVLTVAPDAAAKVRASALAACARRVRSPRR